MAKTHKKLTLGDFLKRFIFITLGAVLMAVALELFLVPNQVIDGGITGISIVLSAITPVPLGLFIFLINIPFLLVGYKQIGKTFAFATLYGIALMSLTTLWLHHAEPFTNEKILAVLFGGLLLGDCWSVLFRQAVQGLQYVQKRHDRLGSLRQLCGAGQCRP